MALIGYTCPYIPVELLALTGFQPYGLLHGDINLSQQGENFVKVDACPLIKSNLGHLITHQDNFLAVVGSTGCDMSRRLFDIIQQSTNIPVYLINNPRTNRKDIYFNEIDWLIKELEHLSCKKFTRAKIASEIEKWEVARLFFRRLNEQRESDPSLISTSQFHRAVINYYQGNINNYFEPKLEKDNKPRVYLLGSAISYESNPLLRLLEMDLRIV
ncbi:MAG: 2-hydroxyacyl-CoA dehydratase family protein, partial [candidate division WOR-3 bacterium]|nr:2-hydroxyacyl-CoA dehydratase family protein [candidate division WOR-3 bacterium]